MNPSHAPGSRTIHPGDNRQRIRRIPYRMPGQRPEPRQFHVLRVPIKERHIHRPGMTDCFMQMRPIWSVWANCPHPDQIRRNGVIFHRPGFRPRGIGEDGEPLRLGRLQCAHRVILGRAILRRRIVICIQQIVIRLPAQGTRQRKREGAGEIRIESEQPAIQRVPSRSCYGCRRATPGKVAAARRRLPGAIIPDENDLRAVPDLFRIAITRKLVRPCVNHRVRKQRVVVIHI